MKIGVLLNCKNAEETYITIKNIKKFHDFDFLVAYENDSILDYFESKDLENVFCEKTSDYIQFIENKINLDYDLLIQCDNLIFINKSLEPIITKILSLDNGWEVCGSVKDTSDLETDTNWEICQRDISNYINFSFGFINPKNCYKDLVEFAENLIEEDITDLYKLILNLCNTEKIIVDTLISDEICATTPNTDLYTYNLGDYTDAHYVPYNNYKFKDFYDFVKDLDVSEEIKEVIETKYENIQYMNLERDFKFYFYTKFLDSSKCQTTISKI